MSSSYNAGTDSCHVPDHTASTNAVSQLMHITSSSYIGYAFVSTALLNTTLYDFASESNIVYWKSGTGNEADNFDLTGVASKEECYQLCQLKSGGVCWIFR